MRSSSRLPASTIRRKSSGWAATKRTYSRIVARATGRDIRQEENKLKPVAWLPGSGLALMVVSLLVFRFYIDPEIISRPDRPGLEPRPPTSFPSDYGSNR